MCSALFAFGMPGPMEMLIVLAIFLLLFGSSRLPSLMRNLGSSAREFKRGVQEIEDDMGEASRKLKDERVE